MLNKQGSSKIDWTDWTWNPISGCLHGCDYCYLKRIGERYKTDFMTPAWRPERLKDIRKAKSGDKIFVGSTGDMFGEWVKANIIEEILTVVRARPDLIFQFLTKNPKRYNEFKFPMNCWLGMTVDTQKRERDIFNSGYIPECDNIVFVSFEPLLEKIYFKGWQYINWIIIGANSNPGAKRPKVEWAHDLIKHARGWKIPVWTKDNFKGLEKIKEFPE